MRAESNSCLHAIANLMAAGLPRPTTSRPTGSPPYPVSQPLDQRARPSQTRHLCKVIARSRMLHCVRLHTQPLKATRVFRKRCGTILLKRPAALMSDRKSPTGSITNANPERRRTAGLDIPGTVQISRSRSEAGAGTCPPGKGARGAAEAEALRIVHQVRTLLTQKPHRCQSLRNPNAPFLEPHRGQLEDHNIGGVNQETQPARADGSACTPEQLRTY